MTERPAPGTIATYWGPAQHTLTVHVADHTGVFQTVGTAAPDRMWTRDGAKGLRTLCDRPTMWKIATIVVDAHRDLLDDPQADLSHLATHTLGRVPGSQRSTLVPIGGNDA